MNDCKFQLLVPEQALPGRGEVMPVHDQHFVNGRRIKSPFPEPLQQVVFGLGCFGVLSACFGNCRGFM